MDEYTFPDGHSILLMTFVDLVPSEHSSGIHRQRGAIAKAGNSHVRPVLAEAAWSYRFLLPSAAFAASSIERDLVLFDLETRRR